MQSGRDLSALPCRVCVGGRTNPAPAVYISGGGSLASPLRK